MLPPFVINEARFTRQRHQRVGADVLGNAEGFAACAEEIAFQRFAWCIRQRVQHQINAIRFLPYVLKKSSNFVIAGNVAGKQRRCFAELGNKVLNIFL